MLNIDQVANYSHTLSHDELLELLDFLCQLDEGGEINLEEASQTLLNNEKGHIYMGIL